MWQISIGDGCACHDWLVDHKGVRIAIATDHNDEYMVGPDTTTIKKCMAPVVLEENLEKVSKLPTTLAYGLIHRGMG
eukprot:SAG11_NODE_2780_length_2977_cov_16.909344_2_plen_77_part_00